MAAKKPTVSEKLDEILAAVERMRQDSAAKGVSGSISISPTPLYAAGVPFGKQFRRVSRMQEDTYQRVRFTGYILNSRTVSESLAAGKIPVLHVEQATIFFISGSEHVTLI